VGLLDCLSIVVKLHRPRLKTRQQWVLPPEPDLARFRAWGRRIAGEHMIRRFSVAWIANKIDDFCLR